MSNQNNFFTQATNFISAVAGGVDPRTGLFNANLSLGHLIGNNGLGPKLPLKLSYTPLNNSNAGFGRGFTLGLSSFDLLSGLLALSTGERYIVESDSVAIKQKKLDNVRLEATDDGYQVIHKNGTVEILGGDFDVLTVTQMISPAGHALTLTWDYNNHLTDVIDDTQTTLLHIDYADSVATLTLLPGHTESYQVSLYFNNQYLTQVVNNALPEQSLIWDLEYQLAGQAGEWGQWLTKVTSPGGLQEEVIYLNDDTNANLFPESASLPALPYVTCFTKTPAGGQPPIISTYQFSTTNFLGYGSGVGWDPQQDNLYSCLSDYQYFSVETRACGEDVTNITRTYNSYHLLINELTQRGDYSVTHVTDYYAVIGDSFDEQPTQFQLPKTHTSTWVNANDEQRTEVTKTTFDDSGNPLTKQAPDGTLTTYTYYPTDGSQPGCPADPYGFKRFIQTVTVTPPSLNGYHAAVQKKVYTYATAAHAGDIVPALVLKSTEQHYSDDTLLENISFAYETEVSDAGRLVERQTTHYPHGAAGDSYTTTEFFTVSDDEDNTEALLQSHSLTTYDRLTLTRSQKHSRYTGLLWENTDAKQNVTTYEYDKLGRKTKHTLDFGTPYENAETYTYAVYDPQSLPDDKQASFSVTTTDVLGNQKRTWLDGLGRQLWNEVTNQDPYAPSKASSDPNWYTLHQQSYDAQGRKLSTTVLDQNGDESYLLQKTLNYDGWGQASTTVYTDGTMQYTAHDPIAMTTTQTHGVNTTQAGNQRANTDDGMLGKKVTTFNLSQHPIMVQMQYADGTPYSTVKRSYDGLGRLRKETDELGHVTTHSYDAWGRLIATTLPDNTQVTRAYADASASQWLSKISVNKQLLGHREFDGLGRIKTSTSGGRTTTYSYEDDADVHPTMVNTPDGISHQYSYINELSDAIASAQANFISQKFTYEPVTGALLSAQEGENLVAHTYYPSGRLQSTAASYSGLPSRSSTQTYTVAGMPHSTTDYAGVTQTLKRNNYGQIIAVDDENVHTKLSYDQAGRLIGWQVTSKSNQYTLDTALVLDPFGRETQRTITDQQDTALIISQTWNQNHQVAQRTTTQNGEVWRAETYTYDSRNRLIDYVCTGTQPPADESGMGIARQQFSYDALGNVLTRLTTYVGGIQNQSTFRYGNQDDPCQLTELNNSHASFPAQLTFTRDKAGRMTRDEAGRLLAYDAFGRLATLTQQGQKGKYHYDALNRLVTQTPPGAATEAMYYHKNRLNYTSDGQNNVRLVTANGLPVAQCRSTTTPSADQADEPRI